ncbi:MAG: vanadium-dependent haloperoxidase [Candidatus Dormibacteraeota bacterium]|nr:vanadium-dependent haloperoxidase [Candidatus Dormibacteraeota bacterium]
MSESEPLRITRRTALKWGALVVATPALNGLPLDAFASGDSIVLLWNEAALQGVRDSKLGPPMVARALAIVHTCIFDAWAAYDHRAVGTRLGGALRRPPRERALANVNKAISFAAYRAAIDLFPGDVTSVFDPLMRRLGYDPANTTDDITTPAGVGNVAARAVLEFRHRDGANQLGDQPGGKPGVAYADYTGYKPANDPMDLRPGAKFDPATIRDPDRWQPLRYVDATGAVVTQPFVGAQWQHVTPFALTNVAQLRSPTAPARHGSQAYESQARALLALSAGLTDEQKMIAEYWADGPHSELPPGHWDLFAQYVSRRDHHGAHRHGVDADVKLFFALTNAVFDASICCWDNKRFFDSVRPITAIRYLFRGQQVRAWGGPYQGTRLIDGADWFPYQASTFPTPPFPEYSSGHSTFSAAGAGILRLFTESDDFGASVTFPAGSSKFEAGVVPAGDVTLCWETFSEAANQAGLSRRYGAIHFEQGDLDARAAGRLVAKQAWTKAQSYISGADDNRDGGDENDDAEAD